MECSTEEAAARCSAGLTDITSFGLQHFLYNNSKILQKVKGHLEDTRFTGITVHPIFFMIQVDLGYSYSIILLYLSIQGEITFDHNGVRRVGKTVVMSYQPCDKGT